MVNFASWMLSCLLVHVLGCFQVWEGSPRALTDGRWCTRRQMFAPTSTSELLTAPKTVLLRIQQQATHDQLVRSLKDY